MVPVLLFVAALGTFSTPPQVPRPQTFGAWALLVTPRGTFIRTPVEAIPADHAALNKALAQSRALSVRCSGPRLNAQLHAGTFKGIEPASSDMAKWVARVRVAYDDGQWEPAMWPREVDTLEPTLEFLDRLARGHEARIEVPIMCRGCEAPPRVVFRVDATGFSDAREELARACRSGT